MMKALLVTAQVHCVCRREKAQGLSCLITTLHLLSIPKLIASSNAFESALLWVFQKGVF